jgi:hypothetical protein
MPPQVAHRWPLWCQARFGQAGSVVGGGGLGGELLGVLAAEVEFAGEGGGREGDLGVALALGEVAVALGGGRCGVLHVRILGQPYYSVNPPIHT